MAKRFLVALVSAPAALIGCHSSEEDLPKPPDLPNDPPTTVTQIASGGFQSPTDAVASPDGSTLYFAAWDLEKQPAVFRVAAEPGSAASAVAVGAPLDAPTGLVLSCDGETVYVADMGGDAGAVLAVPAAGGTPTPLSTTGIVRPSGLAMSADCKALVATGRLDDATPAVFELPLGGAAARVIYSGEPLVSPTGIHVDADGVAWVMDHHAQGADGAGVLFSIPWEGGKPDEVVSNLRMGTPGGVSLTAGGGIAVMPTRDDDGNTQLTAVDIATGEVTHTPTPMITAPAGLRTAREAAAFAVVDPEASAIYLAK